MLVEVATHPQFISNTYLVADGRGGPAFFIDAGGPVEPLIEAAERLGLEPTHVLLTHHHYDHVSEVAALRRRWPSIEVLISEAERELLAAAVAEGPDAELVEQMGGVEAGDALAFGGLEVRALHTPGHTAGMLSFLVGERPPGSDGQTAVGPAAVFTGDTLFKDSVGGVKAPGHSTYADLRDSIMGTLMELPADTVIFPGHADASTVAREWDSNAFIRIWRGLDPEGAEECTALGEPATLVLLGADYDGGTKAWIRWPDGSDDIVPGSRVERAS
jgi:glyoxylase-like metal-dependent hydrolase (beta-lactamase superfamily II)